MSRVPSPQRPASPSPQLRTTSVAALPVDENREWATGTPPHGNAANMATRVQQSPAANMATRVQQSPAANMATRVQQSPAQIDEQRYSVKRLAPDAATMYRPVPVAPNPSPYRVPPVGPEAATAYRPSPVAQISVPQPTPAPPKKPVPARKQPQQAAQKKQPPKPAAAAPAAKPHTPKVEVRPQTPPPAVAQPGKSAAPVVEAAPAIARPAPVVEAAPQPPAIAKPAPVVEAAPQPPAIAKPAPVVEAAPQPPAIAMPAPAEALPIVRDTPELFALMRRVAMQSDVTNAAGVLHAGLGELLCARVALAVISPTGTITCPIPADMADAARHVRIDAIVPCIQHKKIFATDRYMLLPVSASVPAVLVVWRAPRLPAIDAAVAQLAVAAASRLVVIDHFLAKQAADKQQSDADAKSVFRPEALSAARATHRVGEVVDLSPRWVRFGLPVLLGIAVILVAVAALVQVPSYSRGTVVVRRNGHNVISNAEGRISEVLVAPGQHVVAGQPLIVLDTTQERQAFAQVDTVYRDQLGAFLVDPSDESARQSLAGIIASHTSAKETLATKTITAPVDGVIGAVLASDMVAKGEHVLTISPEDSESSIVAFMPGYDLARIKVGMTLQVEMTGYTHKRLELAITEVGDEVISQLQARKQLGQKLADAIRLPSSTVIVKAKLTASSFEADGNTYDLRDGMDGIGEIAVDTRSLLSMVLNRD